MESEKIFKLSDFDYNLPKELIAQEPMNPRDHSRLLVLDKKTGEIEHKHFFDIINYLKPGDLLIMNNSKVIKARLIGTKESGGRLEVFLLNRVNTEGVIYSPRLAEAIHPSEEGSVTPLTPFINGVAWKCLVGGRAKAGLCIEFEMGLRGLLKGDYGDGTWEIEFNMTNDGLLKVVEEIGEVPLPPYIKTAGERRQEREITYQTVFASDDKKGSVAAPTAGLHFTPELLQRIKDKGVDVDYVTLHVGLGTFAPVKTDNPLEHKMHSEYVEIESQVIEKIIQAKKEERRVVAVGTTSTRSLEAMAAELRFLDSTIDNRHSKFADWVNIFIYPGYEFKIVDAMITNFHTPKSTLMMLVSAFAGKGNIDRAYGIAVKEKYRFFSYGDAMFISSEEK